jgi:hypothetical protein
LQQLVVTVKLPNTRLAAEEDAGRTSCGDRLKTSDHLSRIAEPANVLLNLLDPRAARAA